MPNILMHMLTGAVIAYVLLGFIVLIFGGFLKAVLDRRCHRSIKTGMIVSWFAIWPLIVVGKFNLWRPKKWAGGYGQISW